jgi:uncharacterized protein (DUF488 family)
LEGDAKRYLFLGHELGGRPKGSHFYDTEGHVAYGRVAESVGFQKGIGRLRRGIAKFRVAIMCAEEDPTHCHRRLLVARVLGRGAVSIQHIRGDGTLQSESELAVGPQPEELFPREDAWRSTRSVLRRQPRVTSSVD